MSKVQKVAVVGAGLGGLTAAIALIQRGFDVTVYGQADTLGEIGAGIQLSPNASRVLIALGLDRAFEAIAFEPNRHVVRNWKTGASPATQMKRYSVHNTAPAISAPTAPTSTVLQRAVPAGASDSTRTGVTQNAEYATLTLQMAARPR